MRIRTLQAQGFRNLGGAPVEFSGGVNCIFGPNGSGKTNLLEAVHFLGRGRSFRKNAGFPQVVSLGGEATDVIVHSLVEGGGGSALSMRADRDGVRWGLDGRSLPRRPRVLEVAFAGAADHHLFHGSPGFRREWMDRAASALDPSHGALLGRYRRSLAQRNRLLSARPPGFRAQVAAVDEGLVPAGLGLARSRAAFVRAAAPLLAGAFSGIFSGGLPLSLGLDSPWSRMDEGGALAALGRAAPRDEGAGFTTGGPHRDDYPLFLDGVPWTDHCSLGQQKMAFLSLLFACAGLFRYKCSLSPVLLIDDVSGELDRARWRRLVRHLGGSGCQALVTTANDAFREEAGRAGARGLDVEDGRVS